MTKKSTLTVEVNGKKVLFSEAKHAAIMTTIVAAAKQKLKVEILYTKADGSERWRLVAPYSFNPAYQEHGVVYAEEEDGHIKSFALAQIREARSSTETFKPKWPINL